MNDFGKMGFASNFCEAFSISFLDENTDGRSKEEKFDKLNFSIFQYLIFVHIMILTNNIGNFRNVGSLYGVRLE